MDKIVLNNDQLLRNQVYTFLHKQMMDQVLHPGDTVSMKQLIDTLGVSRSPLRDALLLLQSEGFITIFPQRGIVINALTQSDVLDIYEFLGALESRIVLSVFDKIGKSKIEKMKSINRKLEIFKNNNNVEAYNDMNIKFHNVFVSLSTNQIILQNVLIKKNRLYDFCKINYGPEWAKDNIREHQELINLFEQKDAVATANYLRDVHWVYSGRSFCTLLSDK